MEPEETQELSLDTVIQFLKNMQQDRFQSGQLKMKTEKLAKENNELVNRINELEKELTVNENKLTTVEEDYQTFIQIMERARKMTVLDDQTSHKSPKFKMDKNGNLEQVAESNSN